MLLIKHNKEQYLKKIKYNTVPSLKEMISNETDPWKITDKKVVPYRRTTEIKVESNPPLLLHIWVTMTWIENNKERKYILETYL